MTTPQNTQNHPNSRFSTSEPNCLTPHHSTEPTNPPYPDHEPLSFSLSSLLPKLFPHPTSSDTNFTCSISNLCPPDSTNPSPTQPSCDPDNPSNSFYPTTIPSSTLSSPTETTPFKIFNPLPEFIFIFQSLHYYPHLFLVPADLSKFEIHLSEEQFVYLGGRDAIYPLKFFADPSAVPQVREAGAAANQNDSVNPPISEIPSVTSEGLSMRKMVRVLSWNCRGAGRPEFLTELRQLLQMHRPHILIILETKINDVRADHITSQIPMKGRLVASGMGRTGGLWLLWNEDAVKIHSASLFARMITAEVSTLDPDSKEFLLTAMYNFPSVAQQNQEDSETAAAAAAA
ncbi:hypothetical protein COLO4_32163 [Corchorus olitorius]|uniref:Endonuclease/exonuclease/phosphatase domain-containing protein n=1 Tax=Corchorus olitorius TaxID=93759 RepID=A0A1R3H0V5_9ROSI|nr:hypothetical protein COLO4_32163 [Corchorus olitorius]